jgi:hypothetical protein
LKGRRFSRGGKGIKLNQTFWRVDMAKIQRERHSVTFSYLLIISWLGSMFRNITFIPLSDEDVKEIRALLDEDDSIQAEVAQ